MSRGNKSTGKLIFSILFLIVCLGGSYCVFKGINPFNKEQVQEVIEPKKESLSDYTFEDLSEVSRNVAKMKNQDDINNYLRENFLLDIAYQPTSELIHVETKDGRDLTFRFIGYNHDVDSNDKVVGLTFMCANPCTMRYMNEDGTTDGSWKDSDLRAYLNNEFINLLPEDLSSNIKTVVKTTNNANCKLNSLGDTSTTEDKLWLLSASEVCGRISWYSSEQTYGSIHNTSIDDLMNKEGSQYEYFKVNGVTDKSDTHNVLLMKYANQGCAWWYRSPHAYEFNSNSVGEYNADNDSYFYSVMSSGFPFSWSAPETNQGVVFGFCI